MNLNFSIALSTQTKDRKNYTSTEQVFEMIAKLNLWLSRPFKPKLSIALDKQMKDPKTIRVQNNMFLN